MKKAKVLIIENSIHVTGALKSIAHAASSIKEQFDFMFIIPRNSKSRTFIEGMGFDLIAEMPMQELARRVSSLFLYIPRLLVNAYRLNKIVKRNKVSLIHVNDIYNLLPVAIRAFGNTTPYVCHIRFLPDKFPGWLFKIWLKLHLTYADKIIAVSASVLKQLPAHSKLTVIHDELPGEEQEPQSIRTTKTDFTFLYLSNFMRGKGQDLALEAFGRIHNQLPDWKLRFVGGDMELDKNKQFRMELIERAKQLGVFNKTEWLNFADNVEREYKRAEIVLNFSESESFSIVCLEALFFGRPLIATDCGGPAEIIDHEETGMLIPNRSVDAMENAMLKMALNPDLRDALGNEGKSRVRKKFSKENTSDLLAATYRRAII